MGWNGRKMTKPIGMGDIRDAVAYGSLDLGTLIANGIINKWALHKPVRLLTGYDVPNIPQEEWLDYMKTKVREIDNNNLAPYALKVGTSVNIYEVTGEVPASSVDWVYQKPSSNDFFWRRMLDFDGYVTDANPPMNPIGSFKYFNDSSNVLTIDTNDGEAGDTSIQIHELSQLDNYKLMVAVREGSLWRIAVMSSVISQSMEQGEYSISFILPNDHSFAQGTYDAYVVGLSANSGVSENTWVALSDSSISNFYPMLPLPFPYKTDCKFSFEVKDVAPTNVVYLSYIIYLKRDYRLAEIEFKAEKYGQTLSGFVLSVTNIVVHDDNETQTWPINDIFRMDSFSYSADTKKSTCSVRKNLISLGYDINAGDYPNLTYQTQNNGGYTIQDGGYNVVFID